MRIFVSERSHIVAYMRQSLGSHRNISHTDVYRGWRVYKEMIDRRDGATESSRRPTNAATFISHKHEDFRK